MNRDTILSLPGMPPGNPSFPFGPYRFIDREYFIVAYESDPQAVRAFVPEPLEPDGSGQVFYEWIKMPDSSGFGSYTESGVVIPCLFRGAPVNYTAMMFLDNEPATTAGREIWGFPKRLGEPRLRVASDTLTGTLDYGGERVATGTMVYKAETVCPEPQDCADKAAKTQVNLKLIPDVDGSVKVAQLVAFDPADITMKGFWRGNARLDLRAHVNAPVADLPVRRVVDGKHFIADLTLPYGRVLHDYLA